MKRPSLHEGFLVGTKPNPFCIVQMHLWSWVCFFLWISLGESLVARPIPRRLSLWSSSSSSLRSTWSDDEIAAARQFKIVTCSATSCAAKRKALSLDPFATFSAFWERLEDVGMLHTISIEETSCLGACQRSPCVAVEHDDYEGTVALAGMDPSEFVDRVFHSVTDETDVDRVWSIVQGAIQMMAIQDMDDDDDNYV